MQYLTSKHLVILLLVVVASCTVIEIKGDGNFVDFDDEVTLTGKKDKTLNP